MRQIRPLALPTMPVRVQLQNKARWNESRSQEYADFYTISYAGRKIEEVIQSLRSVDVTTLIDVRHVPVSMYRPDFSKANLQRHIEAAGMCYVHFPHLGIPREIRGLAIGKDNLDDLWAWYDRYVVDQFIGTNLHYFLNAADHPVALMCVETDPTACHRHRLGLALERLGLQGFDL